MKRLPSRLKNNFEVNIEDTINSGQVFLWKKFNSKWYGVNGEKTLILEDKLDIDSKDIHNFFRFDDDFQKIKRELSKDEIVKKAIDSFPGMRILRQDPFIFHLLSHQIQIFQIFKSDFRNYLKDLVKKR